MVEQQIPERLRPRINVRLRTDPYHLKTTATFVDADNKGRMLVYDLEIIGTLALKIPDQALAEICIYFG